MGRKLEKYELIEEIGQGGMAVVYRGLDSQLERAVAVKVLHPHLQAQKESRLRFHREAKAVARLRHPNILEIYDYSGAEAAESFIVTELIAGPTLRRFWEAHPRMPAEIAAMIVIEVCRALEHAHSQGIIHRDVKPENVMIGEDAVVKLTDFGIAQILDSTSMTVTGQILGSPAHMSPEHLDGRSLDFRADVFSVGTVLYMLATGRLPFEGKNPHQVLKKVAESDYVDPVRVRPQMGDALARIIRRCLARSPLERYQCVESLRGELEVFLNGLGFADTSALRTFFADPEGFTTAHEKQLLATLIARGNEARKSGERQRAAELYNRVLAIDPHNAEVLRTVGRLVRRERTTRAVLALGAVAALVSLVAVFWPRGALHPAGPSRDRPPVVLTTREARTQAPPRRDAKLAKAAAPADGAVKQSRRGASSAARAAPVSASGQRLVRFVAGQQVRQFDIYVDGARLGSYGPDLTTRALPVGPHQFRFVGANECCQDEVWTEVIQAAGEGGEAQRVGHALRFRPANLNVSTNVLADIEVVGRTRGRSGRLIQVPLNQYTETVRVVARAAGYRNAEASVDLQANAIRNLSLELESTGDQGQTSPAPAPGISVPPQGARAKLDTPESTHP